MKKLLALVAALMPLCCFAQFDADYYLVYTKDAKPEKVVADSVENPQQEGAVSFLDKHFPYQSMCEWTDSMPFLVIPEKRDMVLRQFYDMTAQRRISAMHLKHKVLHYCGHDDSSPARLFFVCPKDGSRYYYEVPNGTFETYCTGKLGVPSLAYLGDVDEARRTLMGRTLRTRHTFYSRDTSFGDEGVEQFTTTRGSEVRVVNVGVGTRAYPVKIIVEDSLKRQFFQNVAMSRTNSGMRDEEFNQMNHMYHTFDTAFELLDDNVLPGWDYNSYKGKVVYTRQAISLSNGRNGVISVKRLTPYVVEGISSQTGTDYMKLALRAVHGNGLYYTEVLFAAKADPSRLSDPSERIFEQIFGEGNPARMAGVRSQNLAAIADGKVEVGFTENEVRLCRDDEPTDVVNDKNSFAWIYRNEGAPVLRVVFNKGKRTVTRVVQD